MTITSFAYHSQLSFDINFSKPLELTPLEQALLLLLENIDWSRFERENPRRQKGRPPSVDAYTMMVLILYGRIQGKHSCRELEAFAKRDLFLLTLFDGKKVPDHVTINRFIKNHPESIEYVFTQSVINLDALGELEKNILFQDGTKIESRANKYTFVWLGSTEKNFAKLEDKMWGLLEEVREEYGWEFDKDAPISCLLLEIKEKLESSFDNLVPAKRGRGHRLKIEQKFYIRVNEYLEKEEEYNDDLETIGDNRRSMSRTDNDATFMRMKDDHMRNGQLKAAYNIQNMVDSGYVVGCYSSSDRSDYNTMVPALNKVSSSYPWKYKGYCADSGYDSLPNHLALRELGITNYIKPQTFEGSKKRKFKNNVGLHQNMQYNESEDYYVCKAGRKLEVAGYTNSRRKYGPQTRVTIYKCKRGCVSCEWREVCMSRNKGKYKTLYVDREFYNFQLENLQNINSEFGREARINRSIQAEGTFAQIKSNLSFTRFKSFGKKRTLSEWILMCFAMNIIRLAARSESALVGTPFW